VLTSGGNISSSKNNVENNNVLSLDENEMNEAYWAQEQDHAEGTFEEAVPAGDETQAITAENDADDYGYDDDFGGFNMDDDVDDVPSSNPFYHGLELGLDFGNSLVAEPKLTKTLKMNYAKTAKKVDVKRLKENLWKDYEEKQSQENVIPFSNLVGGLDKVYQEDKLKEISVPFCFICLLHLANENNLEIKGVDNLQELYIKSE
jgi:condensin complex subunit 2